jgi:S-adenosyl methyltransferase
VLVHARALLASGPEGACGYIESDVRDPGRILAGAGEILDLARPAGLVMFGIMGNVTDDGEAAAIIGRLTGVRRRELTASAHRTAIGADVRRVGQSRGCGRSLTGRTRRGVPA